MTALLAAGTLLLGVSLVTTAVVYHAKTQTDEALTLAQKNFRETQAVVDRFGLQLDNELALIPGTDHVRRTVLNDVIEHYRGFIQRAEQSDGLTETLAITLNKVASLTERVGTPNEALAAHRDARKAFEDLLRTNPDNRDWQSGMALCDNNIGLLFANNNSFAAADKHFKLALDALTELTRQIPEAVSRREMGLTLNNIGLLRTQQNRPVEAVKCLEQASDILSSFNESHPSDEQGRQYLAATLVNLASVISGQSPADARKFHQRAIEIQSELVEANPGRLEFQQCLAVSYDSFGLLLVGMNEHSDAAVAFASAAEMQTDLLARSPNSAVLLRQLAWSENRRGQALAHLGRVPEAATVLRLSLRSQQKACDLSGGTSRDLFALGGIWNNFGFVLEGQQDMAAAAEAYRRAVEQLTAGVDDANTSDRDRDALNQARANLERIVGQAGRLVSARNGQ